MRTERLTRAAAAILFAVVLSTAQAGKWQEYAICGAKEAGAEGDQELADIYGDIVVWQEFVSGNWNIYGADITNPDSPQAFTVATTSDNEESPAVYENIVV